MPDQNANPNPAAGLTLSNTTIVPPGTPTDALGAPETIKMVVLGNRPNVVQIADNLALDPPIYERVVIWFVNGLPANYIEQFDIINLTSVQAFSLSINNEVRDLILVDEVVDNVRMTFSYTKAY